MKTKGTKLITIMAINTVTTSGSVAEKSIKQYPEEGCRALLLSLSSLLSPYRLTVTQIKIQETTIIKSACVCVIFVFKMIARYRLRVIKVTEIIGKANADVITEVDIKQPNFPVDHPPAFNTISTDGSMYKLKTISAQHRLKTKRVSTDLYRTRKIDAMTSVSKISPRSKNVVIKLPKVSCKVKFTWLNLITLA